MRLRLLVASAAMLLGGVAAHADPVTYSISGYLNTNVNITVTGMTTLNICVSNPCTTNNPTVQSIDLNFSNGSSQDGIGTLGQDYQTVVYVGAANDKFTFTDNLHNYTTTGGTFNLADASGDYVGSVFNGTLTRVPTTAATPEPSSLALLGTGILGIIGAARRRFNA